MEGLYNPQAQPENLKAQILGTIIGLKDQVKNGMLPVKTIVDAFNQGKSEQHQSYGSKFGLTYQRIGRVLSAMGFTKGFILKEKLKITLPSYGIQKI